MSDAQTFSDARDSVEYWAEAAILDFTEGLAQCMRQENVSRAELARRIDSSQAYITKVLSGEANFTIATMTKLALALKRTLDVRLVFRDAATASLDLAFETEHVVRTPIDSRVEAARAA